MYCIDNCDFDLVEFGKHDITLVKIQYHDKIYQDTI